MKIGIYKDGEEIQVAKVSKRNFRIFSCDQGNVKSLYKYFLSKKEIVAGLETSDVMVHELNFPTDNQKVIRKGVSFQAKMVTHLDEESSIQLPLYKDKKVYVYSTSLGKISRARESFQSVKIKYLSCTPNALARFFKVYAKGYESGFIFHFAKSSISCVFVKNHIPVEFYLIDKGIEDLLGKDKVDLGLLAQDQQVIFFRKEVTKVFLSFLSKQDKVPVLLTGYVDHFEHLDTVLFSEVLGNITSFVDITPGVQKTHAIAIGLALDALIDDCDSLQFFQKEALPKYLAKSHGKKVLFLLSVCLLLNLVFFNFTHQELNAYRRYLTNRMDRVIAFDEAMLGKEYDLSYLLEDKISEFKEILLNEGKPFTFPLNVANVSKVLYWIYSHPLKDKMQVQSVRYRLESYPSIETPQDRYLAKVNLKLHFKTKKDEENFQDALEKDPFVDRIEWKKTKQNIQTSFYIKS